MIPFSPVHILLDKHAAMLCSFCPVGKIRFLTQFLGGCNETIFSDL